MKIIKRKSAVKPITGSIVDTKNIIDKTTNTYSANIIDTMIAVGGGTGGGSVDISTIIDLIYPIGRGFIDFTDTDYSNWLGLTWERELIGMTPIGKNANDTDFNTVGKTGGEKTHKLTTTEMPSHGHNWNATLARNKHIDAGQMYNGSAQQFIMVGQMLDNISTSTSDPNAGFIHSTNLEDNGKASIQVNGGGQSHNNLQPYQVVSYWKRVAPNAKTMISFTIAPGGTNTGDSVIYQAEEGMTFLEWYNSDYNTWDTNKSYYTSTSDTFSSGGSSLYYENTKTSEYIYGKDTIINGTIVYWYSSEK